MPACLARLRSDGRIALGRSRRDLTAATAPLSVLTLLRKVPNSPTVKPQSTEAIVQVASRQGSEQIARGGEVAGRRQKTDHPSRGQPGATRGPAFCARPRTALELRSSRNPRTRRRQGRAVAPPACRCRPVAASMARHRTRGRAPRPGQNEQDNPGFGPEACVIEIAQVGRSCQTWSAVLKRWIDRARHVRPDRNQPAFLRPYHRMEGARIEVSRRQCSEAPGRPPQSLALKPAARQAGCSIPWPFQSGASSEPFENALQICLSDRTQLAAPTSTDQARACTP